MNRHIVAFVPLAMWLWPATAQPVEPPVREWSPRVAEALAAYRAGQFGVAQDLAQRVLGLAPTPGSARPSTSEVLISERDRTDAAVIQALCLLHGPSRAERVDGRARLWRLMEYDPALRDEPECNLAYGIAQTALSETGAALDALERAAAGFALAGLADRQRVALIELARAWAAHAEWELTPPRLQIPRPKDSADAVAVRRAQIEAVRARAQSLPPAGAEKAVAEINLILGQYLLSIEPAREDGRRLLEQLCAGGVARAPAAQAALALAEHYEKTAHADAALSLYQRVAQEGPTPWSAAAAERHAALTRPELVVEAPARVPDGQPVPLTVRARGLERVNLEVRRLDVVAWLQNPQTRGNDSRLPVSGSVRLARDLDTRTSNPLERWDSDASAEPLRFAAEPGAYVILAQGHEVGGREQTVRRLVLVSDLVAACRISRGFVVVGAARERTADAATPVTGRVRFWMQGSFVPTDAALSSGVAQFALPNEARLMRDDRWYCVIEAGDEVALCRGRLKDLEGALETSAQVLMLAGPPTVKPGEDLHVAGLLLTGDATTSASERASSFPSARTVDALCTLDVVDITDRRLQTLETPVSRAGSFAASIPVPPEWAGQHVRVLARVGGRVAENVAGRTTVAVVGTDPLQLHLDCTAPTWLRDGTPYLSSSVRATWPWGVPAVGTRTECRLTPVHLPATEADRAPVPGAPYELEVRLDRNGRFESLLPATPADFRLPPGPLALLFEVQARTSQGWQGTALQPILVGPHAWHAWLLHTPAEPRVGDEVRFTVGHFAPNGWFYSHLPVVAVHAADYSVSLPTHPGTEGFQTPPWHPAQPGTYGATAEVMSPDGQPTTLRRTFVVHAPTAGAADVDEPRITCRAHLGTEAGEAVARVRLTGHSPEPLLVSVEGRRPLGAAVVPPVAGGLDVAVPVKQAEGGARVWIVALGRPERGPVAVANVAPDPASVEQGQLTLRAPQAPVWPGATIDVAVALEPPDRAIPGTVILARLEPLDAMDAATRFIRNTVRRATIPLALGVTQQTSLADPARNPATPDIREPRSPSLRYDLPSESNLWVETFSAFLGGMDQTCWTMSTDFDSAGRTLSIPVPAQPALYRLLTVAFLPDGTPHAAWTFLDARRGVSVRVDAPARLSVGDRTVVAAALQNPSLEPVTAELRLDTGSGLHIESWQVEGVTIRTADTGTGGSPTKSETRLMLELSAGVQGLVRATVEAFQPGLSTIIAEVRAQDASTHSQANYEVLEASPAAAGPAPDAAPRPPAVRIRRVLTVWTPEELEEPLDEPTESLAPAESKCRHDRRWTSAPWSPTDRLRPGQYLQVREEVAPRPEATELIWAQRIPPTCVPVRARPKEAEPAAALPSPRADELRFRINAQRDQPFIHGYYLMAVRPGVCVLPPPIVQIGDAPAPIAVEPAEIQVIVGE